jgi:hypothetical protein
MSNKIDLDQKLEYKGYWYLPSSPEKKIAGNLTYYPNEKIVLELFGGFNTNLSSLFNSVEQEPIIYGNTSDAKEITLLQCSQNVSINLSADFPIISYSCNFMIIGKFVTSLDEKCHYTANIKIPELTSWYHPKSIDINIPDMEDATNMTISVNTHQKTPNETIVKVDENTSILLKKDVNCSTQNMLLNIQLEQYTYLEIIKQDAVSIKELLVDIYKYEQFISLATLNVVKSSVITLYDSNLYKQFENKKIYTPIYFIHPFTERLDIVPNFKFYEYLFTYSTIQNIYPNILQKWYNAKEELNPIRSHLIESLKKKKVYGSVDFLIIIQAIEGYWWRFKDEVYREQHSIPSKKQIKLNTILTELKEDFLDIALIKNVDIDIAAIVDSRHYYSHFVLCDKKPKRLEGWDLIKQAKNLRLLLICCILSFIGLDNSQINTIFTKSNSKLI